MTVDLTEPGAGTDEPDRDVTDADTTVVQLGGDVDAATAGALRRQLDDAVATGRPLVLVDVSGVGFFDSAGLAVLVRVRRELPPGQQLALVNVPRRMQRVLKVAALASLMRVHACGEPWPWPGVTGLSGRPCAD